MPDIAPPLTRLIDELKRLPGIGAKSAQRIAFHVLRTPRENAQALADAVLGVKDRLHFCSICNNVTDSDPCQFCAGASRNRTVICVVEEPHNILSIEKTRQYDGLYHVLGGAISPLQGIGPEQLKIAGLVNRLRETAPGSDHPLVREVIVATDPDAEGEATALYLSRLLKPLGVKVSRIAMGIPVGSEIEYADEVTMSRALDGRREL
jgi:recombination protein RecR